MAPGCPLAAAGSSSAARWRNDASGTDNDYPQYVMERHVISLHSTRSALTAVCRLHTIHTVPRGRASSSGPAREETQPDDQIPRDSARRGGARARRGAGSRLDDRVGLRRRRPGAHQVFAGGPDHGGQRRPARDRLGVGAERAAAARVRHPPRQLRDDAADDRRRPVPLHHVHAGGGARCRDRRGAVGLRPACLRDRRGGRQPGGLQAPRRRRARGRRRHARLHQQPREPLRARRADRRSRHELRRRRRGRADRRLPERGQRRRVRPDVAAGRLRGSGHRRQPRAGSHPAPLRYAGVGAGVRRAHRRAAVGLLHRAPIERRVRGRYLGGPVLALHRPRQRVGG